MDGISTAVGIIGLVVPAALAAHILLDDINSILGIWERHKQSFDPTRSRASRENSGSP